MSKFIKPRYEYYKGTTNIVDNEVDEIVEDVVERLNTQDWNKRELLKVNQKQYEQIIDLEEQLKNAIVPKFKFMEKVWHINKDYFYKKDWYIEELLVNGFEYKIDKRKNALVMWYSTYFNDYKNYKYQEKELFATKKEAEQKLKEIKNG